MRPNGPKGTARRRGRTVTGREFARRLRNAALGFVLGLVMAVLLPLGMAVWLWSETEE